MLTGRAWAVIWGGGALWVASRVVGAPDLHMAAVGLLALVPMVALLVRATPPQLQATRRLSTRRAFPGTRVRVDLEIHDRGRRRTPVLLLEDRLPRSLGSPARAVLAEVPGGARRSASYHVTPRRRGRYPLGPLTLWVADPFDLVRRRIQFPGTRDLIVYPEVENLGASAVAAPISGAGESSTRQLFRSGEDFYTMRQYELGDDLRRIHWPSVARTGQLMIRQDEAVRRAQAAILLDTRRGALGERTEAFERAVSAAASIGAHYLHAGFSLHVATPDRAPHPVDREAFLELLALVKPSKAMLLTPALRQLGPLGSSGAGLVVATHIPRPEEVAALSRLSGGYSTRLAILVYPDDPDDLPIRPRVELDRRAEAARTSLIRAGWEVLLLRPGGRLGDVWQLRTKRPARRTGVSS